MVFISIKVSSGGKPCSAEDANTSSYSREPLRISTTAAIEINKVNWNSSDGAVLAGSKNFADALVGSTLAYRLGWLVLLTDSVALEREVPDEIACLGA